MERFLKKEKRAEELIFYIKQNMNVLGRRAKAMKNLKTIGFYVGGISFNGSKGGIYKAILLRLIW